MSYFGIPMSYLSCLMVRCQAARRQKEEICCLLLLSSGSEVQQGARERGQELGAAPFLASLAVHPCMWSVKKVYGGFALSLRWCTLRPEEKGEEVLSPWRLPPEFRRTEGQIPRSRRQSRVTHPQEASGVVAHGWVAPAVLTQFNNNPSYGVCLDETQTPLWIILLNYRLMSTAEGCYS